MIIFYPHRDGVRDLVGGFPMAWPWLRLLVRRAFGSTTAVCEIVHRAAVLARMRRLQPGRLFHTDLEKDAAKFPQRPLILDDKWDF